jgi:hypothetical protein
MAGTRPTVQHELDTLFDEGRGGAVPDGTYDAVSHLLITRRPATRAA